MINYIKKHNVKEIWDFSQINVELFAKHSIVAKYVPLQTPKWYSDKLREFRKEGILYDVGISASPTPRRTKIYKKLREKGINLLVIDNKFGDKRDRELAKCKIHINIHAQDDCTIFESARCDAWLSIGVPIVSENSLDNDSRCINVPYNELVKTTIDYLNTNTKIIST